jgi:L-alanine-DL-glutamate epimerase-like enolase superfamily enzyme
MKIKEVKTVLAFGGRQTWVFVLVETDAGIAGVGEASLEGKERAVQAKGYRGTFWPDGGVADV